MKENRFQRARDYSIIELLEMFGRRKVVKGDNVYYQCPIHNDKNPSLSVKNNRFKCWGCGASGSSIDLTQAVLGINEIEAVNYILDKDKIYKPVKKKEAGPEEDQNKSIKLRNMLLKNSKQDHTILNNYFSFRGLGDIYKSIDKDQIQIKSNDYKGKESIVYNFPKQKFSIQRGINEKFIRNYGHVTFVTYKHYEHNKFCIVEGVEDGLSAVKLGYNFITLNSVANVDKLIEQLRGCKEKLNGYKFYISLDNDNAGIEASKILKNFFVENNINFSNEVFKLYYNKNIKDLNDYVKEVI